MLFKMSERWRRFIVQWLFCLLTTTTFAPQVSAQLTCFQVCTCRKPVVTCHLSRFNYLPTFYYIPSFNVLKVYGTARTSQLPPGVFQQTSSIIDLTIDKTALEALECDVFQGMQASLVTLRLTRHAFKEVPKCVLDKLTALQHLYMTDCEIESLVAGDFSSKAALVTIDLSGNRITDINVRSFINMPKLKYLNLSRNKLTNLVAQQFKSLGAPSLELLNVSNNGIKIIARDSFDGIGPMLRRLDLSNNQIVQASWDSLSSLTFRELDTLVMSGNTLPAVDKQQIQATFPRLTSLSLAKCSLSAFNFSDYSYLRSLNVANNDLTINDIVIDNREMPCETEPCPDISVDVSGNKVTSVTVRMDYLASLDTVSVTAIGTGLQMVLVNITQNSTAKDSPASVVLNLSKNQRLKPVQVYIKELGEDRWNRSANISLILSDNSFPTGLNTPLQVYTSTSIESLQYEEVDVCSFTNRSIEIWELDLSGNGISSMSAESCIIGEVTVLKLNRNNIRRLGKPSPGSRASRFGRTRELQLRANALEGIDADAFDGFPKLEYLDLRDNSILELPELTSLKSLKSLKMFALDNNSLVCDCSLAWIQNYGVFFPTSDPPAATISGRCTDGYSVLCYNWRKPQCAVSEISTSEQYQLGRVCDSDDYVEITDFHLSTDGRNILVKWLKKGPALLYGYRISYQSTSSQRADFLVGPASTNATLSLPQGRRYDICLTAILSRTNNLQSEKVYCKGITTVASPVVITLAVLFSFSVVWAVVSLILIIRHRLKPNDRSPRNIPRESAPLPYEIPVPRQSTSEMYEEVP